MRINAERLHDALLEMAQIGATPAGGVTRLALTTEDQVARDLLSRWMNDAGLEVRVDDFGNMIGRRPGTESKPPVIIGSHLDSVVRGGRFDGPLGVLAALEVVRTLNDEGFRTRRPLEVINWTNEEGARFEPAMLCSGAVAGRFDQQYVYNRTDQQGVRFEDDLRRIGYLGSSENRPGPAAGYVELHIEQGPVLEAEGAAVGVVEGIVGITWLEVTIEGQSDHAGPTPMSLRRDALQAAAKIISEVNRLVLDTHGDAVATVGRLSLEPNIINVIPGKVVFSVDFRHRDREVLETLVAGLERQVAEVAAETGVIGTVNRFWTSEPTPFDPSIVDAVGRATDVLGTSVRRLWSAAGHDAKYMADVCPTSMIFIRSQGGLSHAEQEYSLPEDVEAGANTLLLTALELTGAAD